MAAPPAAHRHRRAALVLVLVLAGWTTWLLARVVTGGSLWPVGVGRLPAVLAIALCGSLLAHPPRALLASRRRWPGALATAGGLALVSIAFLTEAVCYGGGSATSASLLSTSVGADLQHLALRRGRCAYAVDLTALVGGLALAWAGTNGPASGGPPGTALRRQATILAVDALVALALLGWLVGRLPAVAVAAVAGVAVLALLAGLAVRHPTEHRALALVALGSLLVVGGLFAVQWLVRAPGVAVLFAGPLALEIGQIPRTPMPQFMLTTPEFPGGLFRPPGDALGVYAFAVGRNHLVHLGSLVAGHVVAGVGLARLGEDGWTLLAGLRGA